MTATRPRIVGLLGGVGSGKSTIASLFARHGAVVLDADALAHGCLKEGAIRDAVAARFGAAVLRDDGEIDRPALGRIVFGDPGARAALEALVHPCVRRELAARLAAPVAARAPLVVLDVPLLLESPLDALCDTRVFVSASRETRLTRVATRGWSGEELDRREAAQAPLDAKRAAAAHQLDNDRPLAEVEASVAAIVAKLAAEPPPRGGLPSIALPETARDDGASSPPRD
jgi:dephospho-CoA kinase